MNQQPLFICDCRSKYDLDEATRIGMVCPACRGNLRRMDSAWGVSEIATSHQNQRVPRGTRLAADEYKVALITLPSRNENDVESVADLIRSLPMPLSLEIFARGDRRYFLMRGLSENLEFAAERLESAQDQGTR